MNIDSVTLYVDDSEHLLPVLNDTWVCLWVERRTVGSVWRPGINWCCLASPGTSSLRPRPALATPPTLNPAPSLNSLNNHLIIFSPDHPNMTSLAKLPDPTPPPCLLTKPLTDLPIQFHCILPTHKINPESPNLGKYILKCGHMFWSWAAAWDSVICLPFIYPRLIQCATTLYCTAGTEAGAWWQALLDYIYIYLVM